MGKGIGLVVGDRGAGGATALHLFENAALKIQAL